VKHTNLKKPREPSNIRKKHSSMQVTLDKKFQVIM